MEEEEEEGGCWGWGGSSRQRAAVGTRQSRWVLGGGLVGEGAQQGV
jgi:hypothetical protein